MSAARRPFFQNGFTLIELIIAMAIFAILAAIAYPSYTSYIMRTKRSDATTSLLTDQQVLERCYSASFDYTKSTQGGAPCVLEPTGGLPAAACGGGVILPAQSQNQNYELTCAVTSTTYTLTMTATGSQAGDTQCPTFSVDNLGDQNPPLSTSSCWSGH